MKLRFALLLAVLLAAVAACGSPGATSYQPAYVPITPTVYGEEVCVNPAGIRVADSYCDSHMIGYYPDYTTGTAIVVPALGSRVPASWSRTRPNITNITIHNHAPAAGGAVSSSGGPAPAAPSRPSTPSRAAAGPAPAAAPSRSSSVTRGGLGVKSSTSSGSSSRSSVSLSKH